MEIKTKFNIGDEVFLLLLNGVRKYPIAEINVIVRGSELVERYKLRNSAGHTGYIEAANLFASKEELLKSL